MNHLVDTNILTRLAEPGHAMHQPALDAVKRLIQQGHKLHVVPQNLYEFWVVCTRPTSVNGLGKTAAEAIAELTSIKSLFLLAEDTPAVFNVWERLVASIPVLGKNAHDARLVAAMMVHGLSHLLTFNAKDFHSYPSVIAMTPADVLTP
jgi:predicted nucleic acid-binding protein